ncbi:MAG: AAA family ATPase [Gemmataceae bacterium]
MSVIIAENDLPQELTAEEAVEAAYSTELAEVASKLQRGLPTLIECDKELGPYLYLNVRNRLRSANMRCLYLDGRPRQEDQQGPMPMGMIGTMISQLREAVRGAVERRVVVLPHLDLLTTSQGGLTAEAREVIPLLYENPELVWLGFKDPSFPLPRVIEHLFPHRLSLLGISRNRLRHLITRRESRKFGREFNPWSLYKFVSGINAVRLRRLLSTLEGEDYPANPQNAFRQLRQATLGGTLEVPNISLDKDIGGYAKVKERLRNEILNLLARKEQTTSEEQIRNIEELVPKGMIFWGPPGTGKTLFAKAMASEIGAAVTIVSGPELKSKWVGESEENLRQIFHKARQSAPSIIVFDELDSFATARGTYTGSGVEHSMVNQLLTEMDGFHKEEMVFVVGTTNFVESLDPALLRPGRFEFHLHIPYPDTDARREIIRIYDRKMNLQMSEETLEHAVRRTDWVVPGAASGTYFSGDHLNALCRSIARFRMRENRNDASRPEDVERALTEWVEKTKLTPLEERVTATHEAGHAVCALMTPHARPIERIALADDVVGALGYVRTKRPEHKYYYTINQMKADIIVCYGGTEAEKLFIGDASMGLESDLNSATHLARMIVESMGMGGDDTGVGRYLVARESGGEIRDPTLSEAKREAMDRRVDAILAECRQKAADCVRDNRQLVETLRDLLIEKKVIESTTLKTILPENKTSSNGPPEKEEKKPRSKEKTKAD